MSKAGPVGAGAPVANTEVVSTGSFSSLGTDAPGFRGRKRRNFVRGGTRRPELSDTLEFDCIERRRSRRQSTTIGNGPMDGPNTAARRR